MYCANRLPAVTNLLQNMSHGAASNSSPGRPVENPYAKGFSAGGSSSGCGALIGSGEVDMGMGGDQGQEIEMGMMNTGTQAQSPYFGGYSASRFSVNSHESGQYSAGFHY